MPHSPSATPVRLVAVALADETTWWLCEPRNAKVINDDPAWTACWCRWLYPADASPESFAEVPGFQPTASIFEVGQDGESKVLHSATLADDVQGTKVTIDRVSYVFVPQSEAKRIDLIYTAMLRRERENVSAKTDADRVDEKEVEEARDGRDVKDEEETVTTPKDEQSLVDRTSSEATDLSFLGISQSNRFSPGQSREGDSHRGGGGGGRAVVKQGHSVSSSISRDTMSSTPVNARTHHGRRRPLEGTTVILAPTLHAPQGDHASAEAFAWSHYFIAHVGSADYLCPAATNNQYGFRLDKVTNVGFPLFLLFESHVNSSYSLPLHVRAVPVHEVTILTGQDGGEAASDRRVLICTRLSSRNASNRSKKHPTTSTTRLIPPTRTRSEDIEEFIEGTGDDSDGSDGGDRADDTSESVDEAPQSDATDDEDLRHERASRKRIRTEHTPAQSHRGHDAPLNHTERKAQRSEVADVEPALVPLTSVSVNLWTEPRTVLAPVAELASQYPFPTESAAGIQTTVLPDGTCATYRTATAHKVTTHNRKTSSSSTAGGSCNAVDDDIRGLLENIELATMQSHATASETV